MKKALSLIVLAMASVCLADAGAPTTVPAGKQEADHAAARAKWYKLQRVNYQEWARGKLGIKVDRNLTDAEHEAASKIWHDELNKAYVDGWDLDGDGKVTQEEFQQVGTGKADEAKRREKELLDKYDKNRDGKIDESELALMRGDQINEMEQEKIKAIIRKYDKTGKGFLNADEQAKLAKDRADEAKNAQELQMRNKEETRKLLEKYDLDKDGTLSEEEIRLMMEDHKKGAAAPSPSNASKRIAAVEDMNKKALAGDSEKLWLTDKANDAATRPASTSRPATEPAANPNAPGAVEKVVQPPNGHVSIVTHGGAKLTDWRPPGARRPAQAPATQPDTQPATAPAGQ